MIEKYTTFVQSFLKNYRSSRRIEMKRELPLVSIIVPNYNYANYLETCLESILNQTYENIEVIFRDNASMDDSY